MWMAWVVRQPPSSPSKVPRQAAAAVVGVAAVPVGLGGGDRGGGRRSPWRGGARSFCRPWPKRYWKIGADAPAGGGLGGGDGVDLGEALGHRLLDDDVEAGARAPRCACAWCRPEGVQMSMMSRSRAEQLVERGRRSRGCRTAPATARAAGGVDVAERRDLVHLGQRLVGLDVRGADPRADDADLEPRHAALAGRRRRAASRCGAPRARAPWRGSSAPGPWRCRCGSATSSRSRSP